MEENEGLRLAYMALQNGTRIDVNLPLRSLWLIVSSLQLTETHPGLNTALKTAMIDIGRHLQSLIVAELPEVAELLEMGWQRKYDHVDAEQVDPAAPDGWYGDDDDDEKTYGCAACGSLNISYNRAECVYFCGTCGAVMSEDQVPPQKYGDDF